MSVIRRHVLLIYQHFNTESWIWEILDSVFYTERWACSSCVIYYLHALVYPKQIQIQKRQKK